MANARCDDIPLGGELALLVGSHECVGEAESSQGQVALGALAGIVDEGNGLGVVLLVVVEVLDEVEADKVAHVGANVPADVVGVDVDLLQVSDHLVLVGNVCLLARGGGSHQGAIVLVSVETRGLSGGEVEGVGDLENTVLVHADQRSGGGGRERRGAVLGNLHDDLYFTCISDQKIKGVAGSGRGVGRKALTTASTWTAVKGASLVESLILTVAGGTSWTVAVEEVLMNRRGAAMGCDSLVSLRVAGISNFSWPRICGRCG